MSIATGEQTDRGIKPIGKLSDVVRMTQELFSGPVSTETMCDPESPGEAWAVVTVEATGEPKDLVKLRCQWHERLAQQFPECIRDLRLSILPPA
jgi:hypothetical protein